MRLQHATALIITLAVSIIFAGCAGKIRYPSYYTLHVPAVPDPPAGPEVHASLAVREFRSPGYLRQGPLVYRVSAEQIDFYDYHRWAVDPRQFVKDPRMRLKIVFRFSKNTFTHANAPF